MAGLLIENRSKLVQTPSPTVVEHDRREGTHTTTSVIVITLQQRLGLPRRNDQQIRHCHRHREAQDDLC